MTESKQLLADYVQQGSESAFRELVSRYVDLVYSTALRLVDGNSPLAQDVAQTVFADLARMSRKLSGDVMLGGWLHRHTCNVARTIMRSERRRQHRERQAAEMSAQQDHSESNLAQLTPVLDEAIDQLNPDDRAAILLRFFERSDFRSIGDALGSNEDAAQKRVTRAVEKLHSLLKHRGVTLSVTTLGAVLAAEAVTAAPAGLSAAIAVSAISGAGTTVTLLKIMTATKIKIVAVSALAVAAVGAPLAVQHQSNAKLQSANQLLIEQSNVLAQLSEDNQRLSNQVSTASSSPGALSEDPSSELLRLRGEVAVLRGQQNDLEKIRAENRQLREVNQQLRSSVALVRPQPSTSNPSSWDEVNKKNACINNLRQIDGAMQQFALEHNLSATNIVTADDLRPYIGRGAGELPRCPSGGVYSFGSLTNPPTCSIPGHALP